MTKEVNRNSEYMKEHWGTEFLSSDYGWEYRIYKKNPKMLQEIVNDIPKKHNFDIQNDLHAKIRNDDDYDDWEYGTEPLYEVTK